MAYVGSFASGVSTVRCLDTNTVRIGDHLIATDHPRPPGEIPQTTVQHWRMAATCCAWGAVVACLEFAGWMLGILESSYSLQLGATAAFAAGSAIVALSIVRGEQIEERQHVDGT